MAKKEEKPKNTPESDGKDDSVQKMLYSFILDPSKQRLPELTDLPVLQITPLTWMAANDEMVVMCVGFIQYAVDLRKYKRYAAELLEYNEAVKRGGKKVKKPGLVKKPELPQMKVLPERWREWLYKHRRSLSGAGVMRAAVLAERQLEVTQEMQSPDQLRETGRD